MHHRRSAAESETKDTDASGRQARPCPLAFGPGPAWLTFAGRDGRMPVSDSPPLPSLISPISACHYSSFGNIFTTATMEPGQRQRGPPSDDASWPTFSIIGVVLAQRAHLGISKVEAANGYNDFFAGHLLMRNSWLTPDISLLFVSSSQRRLRQNPSFPSIRPVCSGRRRSDRSRGAGSPSRKLATAKQLLCATK
jgi:hypothetical protein